MNVQFDKQEILDKLKAAGKTEIDGIKIDLDFITEENTQKILDSLDTGSPLYNALKDLFAKFGVDVAKLEKGQEKETKAKSARDAAWDKLKGMGSGKVGIGDIFGVTNLSNPLEWSKAVAANAKGLADLTDTLGLGETEFGEGVHKFAEGCESFDNAISDFMSGNVFGGVNNLISGFQSIGGIFGGRKKDTVEDNTNYIKGLQHSIDENTKAINRLTQKMDTEGYKGIEEAYEAQIEYVKRNQEGYLSQIDAALSAWRKGPYSGYEHIQNSLTEEDRRTIQKYLGENAVSGREIRVENWTAEGLAKLREEANDLWQKLTFQAAQGAVDASEYMENYADTVEEIENLSKNRLASINNITFDSLSDSFLSALNSMEDGATDTAENISKIMAESLIKDMYNTNYRENINAWYEELSKTLKEENEDKREAKLAELRKTYQDYMDAAAAEAQAIKDATGYTGAHKQADQKATANMADKATYDQFELYLGIATAQQIALEQGNDVRLQILDTLNAMQQISSPNGAVTAEIRNLVQTSNEYLLDIKKSNRLILDNFGQKMDDIYNLIDDRL